MKFYLYFASILMLFVSSHTVAQTKVLRLHPNNTRPIDGAIDYNTSIGGDKGRFWEVWSDRNGNETYNEASSSSGTKRTINYLDQFYVIGEDVGFVHLAKGDRDPVSGKLNNMQDYGWAHKQNMVVWPYCVQSKASITKKAILLNNIDTVSKADINSRNQSINFYNSPDISTGKKTGDSRLFEVFYVYKLTPTSVLLGKSAEITDHTDVASNLLGWVDRKKVVFWDNRVAIEANWLESAIKERNERGIKAAIFDRVRSAQVCKKGQKVSDDHIYLSVADGERKDGYTWRFPVFNELRDPESEGIINVGAMGKIVTQGQTVNPDIRASLLRKYEKARESQKNINVVLVLDGTEGMKEYYNSVVKALQVAQTKLAETSNTIKFGVVVYRDSDAGNKMTEVKPVTSKLDNVIEFINTINTGYNTGATGMSLYGGLKAAVEKTNINAKHTNLFILAGRKGDHGRSGTGEAELVDMLFRNNCHLMTLQVQNQEDDTYQEFTYQLNDLITKVAQRRYEKYKSTMGKGSPPKLDEVLKGDYQKFALRNTSGMGELVFPNVGESLTTDALQKEMSQIVLNANARINGLLNVLDRLFKGSGATKDNDLAEFNASVMYFIIDQAELTDEEQGSVSFNDFQGSKEGYAVRQVLGMNQPLFKSVLFLDIDELNDMYERFKQLDDQNGTLTEQRENMVQAWKVLLRRYEGGEDNAFENLTMDVVNEKVFGLPGGSPLLRGLKLRDIYDLPDEKFQKYVSSIRSKRQKLMSVLEERDYKFAFQSYGRKYYWIDEDLLP